MKKYLRLAPVLFAVSTIAFGLIEIITGNFHKGLLPVPLSLPGRTILVYSSGVIFVILGTGLFVNKWRNTASFYLGIVYLIFFVFLHLVKLSADIYDPGEWTAAFEVLILCSGAFFIAGKLITMSRYSLALSFIVFAILHFKYADYISTLVPAWVPAKLFLAYFIGLAFLLTAISILLNILTNLSTGLIGFMFLLWVMILHGPRTITAMNSEPEWTSLFVALAAGGTSFMLSYLSTGKTEKKTKRIANHPGFK